MLVLRARGTSSDLEMSGFSGLCCGFRLMDPSRMSHDQAGVLWISVLLFPSHTLATASSLIPESPKVVGASPGP